MEYKYIYGPIPSRRLGYSLGISTMPKKTCNYSCIYCQLGRTNHMRGTRALFYPVADIMKEFEQVLSEQLRFDVVSIVGEGEPTLYLGLGTLIKELKKRTDKPVTVITNGAMLSDSAVREELLLADIVLPSLNAYNEETFRIINRPYKTIHFADTFAGLKQFSKMYSGQIWLEIMLLDGINDDEEALESFRKLLAEIRYDRLYLNTPVRPPAEADVKAASHERIMRAVEVLGGTAIDLLSKELYQSGDADDFLAVKSNIRRHPMNQHEIRAFLESRKCIDLDAVFNKLNDDTDIEEISYRGYITYRLK